MWKFKGNHKCAHAGLALFLLHSMCVYDSVCLRVAANSSFNFSQLFKYNDSSLKLTLYKKKPLMFQEANGFF